MNLVSFLASTLLVLAVYWIGYGVSKLRHGPGQKTFVDKFIDITEFDGTTSIINCSTIMVITKSADGSGCTIFVNMGGDLKAIKTNNSYEDLCSLFNVRTIKRG